MRTRLIKLLITVWIGSFVFASSVVAQQQTGQTIPETRNPQSTTGQPFQQKSDLQNTETEKLLNQNRVIVIPEGRPAKRAPEAPKTNQSNFALAAIIIGLAGVALIGVWLNSVRKDKTTEPATPEPTAQKPKQTKTARPKTKNSPKKRRNR